jgi:hypothetical protein
MTGAMPRYTYVFCLAMRYVLLRTYVLCYAIPRPPTWWTQKAMCYEGLVSHQQVGN